MVWHGHQRQCAWNMFNLDEDDATTRGMPKLSWVKGFKKRSEDDI